MQDYPSMRAMKAAVELEIFNAIGRIQTVGIGDLIQKVIDATIEDCARELETSYPEHAWLNAACAAIRSRALARSPQGTASE